MNFQSRAVKHSDTVICETDSFPIHFIPFTSFCLVWFLFCFFSRTLSHFIQEQCSREITWNKTLNQKEGSITAVIRPVKIYLRLYGFHINAFDFFFCFYFCEFPLIFTWFEYFSNFFVWFFFLSMNTFFCSFQYTHHSCRFWCESFVWIVCSEIFATIKFKSLLLPYRHWTLIKRVNALFSVIVFAFSTSKYIHEWRVYYLLYRFEPHK